MLFKNISYLELWLSFCSAKRNHLCNLGRGYYEEQFCELFWILTSGSRGDAFKRYFLSGALVALLFSAVEPFVQFWQRILWRTILWINFGFGPEVLEMSFKDISYLELWPPFCSAKGTICAILVEGLWGTNLWNYFEFDQWFKRRWLLKIFLIWSSGGPFVQKSRTICAILVEGIMRNNSVK